MSSKKLKVPSSARRHIKYERFSSFVSTGRLKRVQNIIIRQEKSSRKIDGILCISGIDSRYNEGMSELLHYLLFGFFEVRKKELESSGFSEEVIDDLMIFIRCDRVEIYCNPVNYHYLLPYVSHWPSVQFHCLSADKFDGEDDDYAEEFKIHSIINMVAGCESVGLPFSGKGQSAKFDVMAIEKWPIIQAFALEDFGGGGFFTLNHEVVDISADVHQLHELQDPVSVEILLTEHQPLLQKHWDTMIKSIDLELASNVNFLSHRKVSEPFSSYYNHGMVGHKQIDKLLPFVAFGRDAEGSNLRKILKGETKTFSDLTFNKTADMEYMICQIVSPQSPLACTRTYFFCHQNSYQAGGQGDVRDDSRGNNAALGYVVSIYLSMVQAVLSAIDVYSQKASLQEAKKEIISTLIEGTQQIDNGLLKKYFSNSSNYEFKIEVPDLHNSSVEEGQHCCRVKRASLMLYDIPPYDKHHNIVGSLAFSETFLDSRIFLEGSSNTSSDFLVLTSSIPRIHLWTIPVRGRQQNTTSIPVLPVDLWGNPLATQDDIEIFPVWNTLLPPVKMSLTAWEKGLTAKNSSFNSFALHANQIKSLSLFDGDSMAQVSFLIVELNSSQEVMNRVPPHLCIPDNWDQNAPVRIVFAFNPHSKGRTKLYGEILPVWKENSYLPSVQRLEFLDPSLEEIHNYLHNKLSSVTSSNVNLPLKKMSGFIPNLSSFLDHLTCSSRVDTPVKREVFSIFSGSSFSSEDEIDEDKIIVSILAGAPGSEKNSLSSLITTFNNHVFNWLVYKQPEECSVNAAFLHRSMAAAVQSRDQWRETKRTRVILVAPGFCDTSDVIRIMLSHPDLKIRSQFKVGVVTLCIDPLNVFMENKITLPMMTSQCAQGWVNNVIFTSQTNAPSSVLDEIQDLIRSINSDVALLKAENGDVQRSTDLDLIMSETAFDEPDKVKARALIKPFWLLGHPHSLACHPPMTDVILKFSQPLEKHLFLIKLRSIRSSHREYPFGENIYYVRGFLAFTSSASSMTEVQFSILSGKLVMNDSQSSSVASESDGARKLYIISFTGVGLKERSLKEFLNACVKQKPEKKRFITKQDISERELERIHTEHRRDDLPDGWYYNGSVFVSMAGERSRNHPNIDAILDAYVAKKNADIDKHNANIDSQNYVSLFP